MHFFLRLTLDPLLPLLLVRRADLEALLQRLDHEEALFALLVLHRLGVGERNKTAGLV